MPDGVKSADLVLREVLGVERTEPREYTPVTAAHESAVVDVLKENLGADTAAHFGPTRSPNIPFGDGLEHGAEYAILEAFQGMQQSSSFMLKGHNPARKEPVPVVKLQNFGKWYGWLYRNELGVARKGKLRPIRPLFRSRFTQQ